MESFSLLKYWKSKGGGSGGCGGGGSATSSTASVGEDVAPPPTTTTIVTTVAGGSDSDGGGDDGPFFDLEFAVPTDVEEGDDVDVGEILEERENDDDEEEESILESPSDAVFLNDRVVQLGDSDEEEMSSKSAQFPIPASLLRSATKFRVFMLGLKRSKSESNSLTEKPQNSPQQSSGMTTKKLTVKMKFRVEDVRLFSLLTRATSNSKLTAATAAGEEPPDTAEEKRQKKELIQKYLNLVKPLYIRALKRRQAAEDTTEATVEKNEGKKGMRLMKKQMLLLRNNNNNNNNKSKSAVVHSMPHNSNNNQNNNSNYNNNNNVVSSKRRDDSLLEQQDGIQGAILHCKRSFRSATPGEESPENGSCQEETTAALVTEVTRQEVENDVVSA